MIGLMLVLAISTAMQAEDRLEAPDPNALDYFGYSVAIDGDTAVVGAYLWDGDGQGSSDDRGAVYVFTRDGNGDWTQQGDPVTADDAGATDRFGTSVAISGDTIAVGAINWDKPGSDDCGAVYIFTRDDGNWTQQGDPLNPNSSDFGYNVAIDGDTMVAGDFRMNVTGALRGGAAFVYTRSGTTWMQRKQLLASDPNTDDIFGCSVAIDGDTIVVGSRHWDSASEEDCGAAYVFTGSGATWTQQGDPLEASDAGEGDEFGYSVSVDGDTLVAGALWWDAVGGTHNGAAYVFTRDGNDDWTEQATSPLTMDDGADDDHFGNSVSICAETIVVGVPGDDGGGSVYVFQDRGSDFTEIDVLTFDDSGGGWIGNSVAVDGNTTLAGNNRWDGEGPITDCGAVYVFDTGNDTPVANYEWYAVKKGTTLTVSAANGVLANDTDDGYFDPLEADMNDTTADGNLTLSADGGFTYVAPATRGMQTFSYRAFDGELYSDVADANIFVYEKMGDATMNGVVDGADLGRMLANWKNTGDWSIGDFTGDNYVDSYDELMLLLNYSSRVPAASTDPNVVSVAYVRTETIDSVDYKVWELRASVETNWAAANIDLQLTDGTMYQDAMGGYFEPSAGMIYFFPSLEHDTYLTSANSSAGGGVSMSDTAISGWWKDVVNDEGAGVHKIAQITLSTDADGSMSGESFHDDPNSAWKPALFEFDIVDGNIVDP